MREGYSENVQSILAAHPFAVALRSVARSVVLVPAWRSKSDFGDNRVKDRETVRHILTVARSEPCVMAALRRICSEVAPGSLAHQPSDGQIVEAVVEAISRGVIYVVKAEETWARVAPATPDFIINYASIAARFAPTANPHDFFRFLGNNLPEPWCDAYSRMPGSGGQIVHVSDQGYIFLFDLGVERVVVAFGTSRYNPNKRDSDRMGEFLGAVADQASLNRIEAAAATPELGQQRRNAAQLGWRERFFRAYGHKFDRGHFMSHRQGGGLDINLFPQRADINQGHGEEGVAYRAMERACVDDAGKVFCFSRPIYDDRSWVPAQLEYGVAYEPRRILVKVFPNK
jgi:hypothetical protein